MRGAHVASRAIVVVLSGLVVGGQGKADFYDGKMLLQDCQGGDDQQETQNFAGLSQWGTCVGYIAAVVDTMSNASLTAELVNAHSSVCPNTCSYRSSRT